MALPPVSGNNVFRRPTFSPEQLRQFYQPLNFPQITSFPERPFRTNFSHLLQRPETRLQLPDTNFNHLQRPPLRDSLSPPQFTTFAPRSTRSFPSCICRCLGGFLGCCVGIISSVLRKIRQVLSCLFCCSCRAPRQAASQGTFVQRTTVPPHALSRPTRRTTAPSQQPSAPNSTSATQRPAPSEPYLPNADPTHESSRFLAQIGVNLNRLHARTAVCKEILRHHFSQNPYITNRSGFNRNLPADSAATIVKIRYNGVEEGYMVEQSFANWAMHFENKVSQFLREQNIYTADQATVEIQTIFVQRLSRTQAAYSASSASVAFPNIQSQASSELHHTLSRPYPGYELDSQISQLNRHLSDIFSRCLNEGTYGVFPEGSQHSRDYLLSSFASRQIHQAINNLRYY